MTSSPVRISNARELGLLFCAPEYSSISAFNLDGSKLLLIATDHFQLYTGSGISLRDLPTLGASCRPRWSRRFADRLYYIERNELKVLYGDSPAYTLATFPEYESVDDRGEADTGPNDARVLIGDGRHVVMFWPDSKRKSAVLELGDPFDSLMLTPDGNLLVSWLTKGPARHQGIELFDAEMKFQRQVFRCNGHKSVCRDADGSELLVITNSDDPNPIAQNAIVKVRLSDGLQTPLLELDWSLAVHISAPEQAGFCIVSTYQPVPKDVQYAGQILRVNLDGSGVRVLADHGSKWLQDDQYNSEPKASVSRDGRKLVYASNMGKAGANYCDAFLMTIDTGQTDRRIGPRRLLSDRRTSTSTGPDCRALQSHERKVL